MRGPGDSTTIKELKEKDLPIVLKKGKHQWDANISVNSSGLPILLLYKDSIPFDNLVLAPELGLILYRTGRKNHFKGRIKQTTYNLI